jgi:DNA-binding transcriptional ArsR family regulator
MAKNKFTKADRAARFRMLSDETKLRIIEALISGPKNVTDLACLLKVRQPLVSHHLSGLRDHGIATCDKVGREAFYRLTESVSLGKDDNALDFGCCRIQLR